MKRISLKVIPQAKKNRLVEEAGMIKVYLTAPPVEGKANAAPIDFLSEHFQVKRREVRIVRGEKSRNKVVEIL